MSIGFYEEPEESKEVDEFRRAIARRIALESDRLVDELFGLVYDPETEPKVKLSAINTLLDRGIPKLGIQHTKEEETEERGSRKHLREEIEKLIRGEEEEEK
jgi:hypothetical protein